MNFNCHTFNSLRSSTFKTKQLFSITSENGLQTLALTDITNSSPCFEYLRLSTKYQIKPVLGIEFRNVAQQQFILIAKNKNGYKNLNDYLSKFLYDSDLKIPEDAPELEDVFVIYPYIHKKADQLKENEFLGIKPKDLNHLKFSKWTAFRNKLVVLHTVSFQNKKDLSTPQLIRAIDNNILLSKLSKSEQHIKSNGMLPYLELWTTYTAFPELEINTETIPENCQSSQHSNTTYEDWDIRNLRKLKYEGLHYRYKKLEERIFS